MEKITEIVAKLNREWPKMAKGNKAAGKRSRKLLLELSKEAKDYRTKILKLNKGEIEPSEV
jgi:hypothetical protein